MQITTHSSQSWAGIPLAYAARFARSITKLRYGARIISAGWQLLALLDLKRARYVFIHPSILL
jgi:hypothetical protein